MAEPKKNAINKDTIKNLSQLSRIECNEADQEALLKDLQSIINYFEQLEEVDTTNVAPCNHVLSAMVNVEREDAVKETLPRETFLSNASSRVGGLIKVPPVITKANS
jgi:aspartyl-tRNA(Asn)/glutamyl-tRNA(Gln) amidotransferase subunit C